jgi:hypothetical protein
VKSNANTSGLVNSAPQSERRLRLKFSQSSQSLDLRVSFAVPT